MNNVVDVLQHIIPYPFWARYIAPYQSWFEAQPPFIRFALVVIVLALAAILFMYALLIITRLHYHWKQHRETQFRQKAEALIIEHVMLHPDIETRSPEQITLPDGIFRQALRLQRRWQKQVLIDVMMYYHKNFAGKTAQVLRRLYIQLRLDKLSYRKLRSWRWNRKIQGLHELAEMQLQVPEVTMLELTTSRNRVLRMEAQAAYIRLSKNEPFKFFDHLTGRLLPWEQLFLFEVITHTQGLTIPSFSRWLHYSENTDLKLFCLKLIVHFNQFNAIPAVMKLLEHRDAQVRAAAIDALGQLEAVDAEDQLVQLYVDQPITCQVAILRALGHIRSGRYLHFLREEFLRSQDYAVRKEAARALIAHGDEELIQSLLQHAPEERKRTLEHCLDPLIKY
ncbi:MAG: HEAT repeat domain-containing protein [Thermoflavifilum sp.]|uniref:HEAT repeat domain-containing protein n=1 Tax=Thermoflavifilum sp. TaxID=1968839 RepID=UPI0018A46212|nr:HEAT repeat domain-containing protein [Thermoflavifilum sp.]QOR76546.1 MAG: HEAT repeat domain-containing protein [Thermoflavifilum sp.]